MTRIRTIALLALLAHAPAARAAAPRDSLPLDAILGPPSSRFT